MPNVEAVPCVPRFQHLMRGCIFDKSLVTHVGGGGGGGTFIGIRRDRHLFGQKRVGSEQKYSLAVLLRGSNSFLIFYKMKFGDFFAV